MRTTVKLDDDVAALLKKEARKTGEAFKQLLNRYLRLGFMAAKQPPRKPFKVKPWNLQLPPFEKVEELLERLEGADYR